MYICQICATEYEVKNPSIIRKTDQDVKYIRCPKDNGYAFEEPKTEKQEVKVEEAKVDASKEKQNKAATPPTKKRTKKVETKDVEEKGTADEN